MWRNLRLVSLVLCLALGLVVPVGCFFLVAAYEFEELKPRGETLEEHLALMPEPLAYCVITKDNQEYLSVFGPKPSTRTIPYGNSIYIFDRHGQIVDWTPDRTYSSQFNQRWPVIGSDQKMSREQAVEWTSKWE